MFHLCSKKSSDVRRAVYNSIDLIRDAALAGAGLSLLPRDQVEKDIKSGHLIDLLVPYVPPLPEYYLYYANRRMNSPGFRLVVDALRYRSKGEEKK